jgi:hypothetical protein
LIISLLNGGLGNQLFQYAAGRCLALFHRTDHVLDVSQYGDEVFLNQTPRNLDIVDFNISSRVAIDQDLAKLRPSNFMLSKASRSFKNKFIKKYYLDWHPEIFLAGNKLYLDGYFQCEKYFIDVFQELRNEFTLREEYLLSIANILSKIQSDQPSISIHIRRGDYVNNQRIRHIYDICTLDYYSRATQELLQQFPNARLFIFSDDINWVQSNMPIFKNATLISDMKTISGENLRPSQELFLMSQCDHHIIANSSFSWWGAYLNASSSKVVIAPNIWNRSKFFHQNDIIPEAWMRLPVHE